MRAIGMRRGGKNTRLFRGLEDYCPGPVAKQYASSAIILVKDSRKHFRANNQGLLVAA
jgi:hypothetical protein